MKRLLSLTLAVLMVLSLSASAFAEGKTETWDKMGFTLTYPEEFNNTKGIFLPYPYPTEKDGIYTMMFNYYAFSKEDSDAFNEKTKNGGLSEEDTARILDAQGTLLFVMGIDGGRGAQELLETLGLKDAGPEALTEVGKHDDITYFALMAPELYSDYVEKIPAEYAEEYRSLQTAMVEVLKQAEYFTPRNGSGDLMGSILQFETVDLDGNVVKS